MPSGALAGRRSPSSPPTRDSAPTCRTGCRVRCSLRMVARPGRGLRPGRARTSRTAGIASGDRQWVQGWSPEQIANRLRAGFPDDGSMRISHEAIYQALYIQGRGALKRELVACLRTGRALRGPRSRTRHKAWAHVTPEVTPEVTP